MRGLLQPQAGFTEADAAKAVGLLVALVPELTGLHR